MRHSTHELIGRGFRRRTTRDCGNVWSGISASHVASANRGCDWGLVWARPRWWGRDAAGYRPVEELGDQHTRLMTRDCAMQVDSIDAPRWAVKAAEDQFAANEL